MRRALTAARHHISKQLQVSKTKATMSSASSQNGEEIQGIEFKNLVRSDLKDYSKAANMKFNEHVKSLMKQGRKVHHFGFGQAPFPVMEHLAEALVDHINEAAYLPVAGIQSLRQAICKFHEKYDNLRNLDPNNVIVGPGTKELIYLMMMVFNGDVLVLSPSWTTYKPQASLARHNAVVINTKIEDEWRLTPEAVDQAIQNNNLKENRILVLCNPDNPTGTCYSPAHLKSLSKVFRKHGIIVISDEIYGRLHYKQQHATLAKYYPEGTVLSSGMSKWASAGGWRVGYHIYPPQLEELKAAVHSAASHTYSTCPAPMQFAVAEALNNEARCEDYMKHTSRVMAAVAGYCYEQLTAIGIKAVRPTAGYYMFPNFEVIREGLNRRGITTGDQMCEALFEESGVALMAGGPAYLRPIEEFTTRLCFVNFDGAPSLAASRQLGLEQDLPEDFVLTYCRPVCDGVQALKQWVEKHKL